MERLGFDAAAGAIDLVGQAVAIVVGVIDVGAVADLGSPGAVAFCVVGVVVGAVTGQAVISAGGVAGYGAVAGFVVGVAFAERAAAGGSDLAGGVIAKADGAVRIGEGLDAALVVIGPAIGDQRRIVGLAMHQAGQSLGRVVGVVAVGDLRGGGDVRVAGDVGVLTAAVVSEVGPLLGDASAVLLHIDHPADVVVVEDLADVGRARDCAGDGKAPVGRVVVGGEHHVRQVGRGVVVGGA